MSALRSGAWMLSYQVMRLILGFLLMTWVARSLGPQRFGDYHAVLAVVLWLSGFATLGLQELAMQRAAVSARPATVLGTVLKGRLLAGCLLMLLAIVCAGWWMPVNLHWGWMIALFLLPAQAFEAVEYGFINQQDMRPIAVIHIGALLMTALATGAGLLLDAGTAWFLAAFGLEHLVVAAFYTLVRHQASPGKWNYDPQLARELLRDGWPMLFSSLAYMFYVRMDTAMLRVLAGEEPAGIYAASGRLAQIGLFLAPLIANTIAPILARSWRDNPSRYQIQILNLYSVLAFCGGMIALLLTFTSPWLVTLLFGESYALAAWLLPFHAWTAYLLFVHHGLDRAFVTEGRTFYSMLSHLGVAVMNFSLNLWLIPLYGIWGSVCASLGALLIGGFLFPLLFPAARATVGKACRGLLGPLLWLDPDQRQALRAWIHSR